MYRENYKSSLQSELYEIVKEKLTPVALKYNYSEISLEAGIMWKPVVLILGNYSSGKSTLINEYLGGSIQETGQAPTDDSFTIISYDEALDLPVQIIKKHDGNYLLNDPEYPFEKLKKYGQRFVSHICLKKVNSPFLKEFAIIDTPGMLDSISEKDRGYNYQDVIGDLARISDLILVLFDPHKAGTVQETYTALRETLPAATYEERVLFVLNRIDECASMTDLIDVYGTLCWNLSQMIGRKDIPAIHLTYSKGISNTDEKSEYLKYLENKREKLKSTILKAPDYRLEHLATFVESHSENLTHFIEALINYKTRLKSFNVKFFIIAFILFLLAGGLVIFELKISGFSFEIMTIELQGLAVGAFLLLYTGLAAGVRRLFKGRLHKKQMDGLDNLTPLENQRRKDSWKAVRQNLVDYLEKYRGKFSLRSLIKDYQMVHEVNTADLRDIREALKELSGIPEDEINNADKLE